mmetsp:Transcript_11128/g.28903  ORF Transcript_11128/g.28903 Transcript_11128/m.28903 type:complete len:240 (-) Transcript_11128:417-1136(-)
MAESVLRSGTMLLVRRIVCSVSASITGESTKMCVMVSTARISTWLIAVAVNALFCLVSTLSGSTTLPLYSTPRSTSTVPVPGASFRFAAEASGLGRSVLLSVLVRATRLVTPTWPCTRNMRKRLYLPSLTTVSPVEKRCVRIPPMRLRLCSWLKCSKTVMALSRLSRFACSSLWKGLIYRLNSGFLISSILHGCSHTIEALRTAPSCSSAISPNVSLAKSWLITPITECSTLHMPSRMM